MKYNQIEWLVIILLIATPFGYLYSVYDKLPTTIATHFNLQGKADGYGDKSTLIFSTTLLAAISIGTYFLVKYVHKIDPKKSAGQSPELLRKIALITLLFMSFIQLIIIHSSVAEQLDATKYIFPAVGIFLAILGNFMHSIKPNYFIGFKLPWTLENEENWRKTHYLVSKVWVTGGLLITVISLIASPLIGIILSGIILLVMIISPIIYSYHLYQQINKQ